MREKMISMVALLVLVGCGDSEFEDQTHIYCPCSESEVENVQESLVGTWRIDEGSLNYLRSSFGWNRFLDKDDHWFVIESDGTAFVHMCLLPYCGKDGDNAYENEMKLLAQDECLNDGKFTYRMHWRITSPGDIARLTRGAVGDPYNDFFGAYYINVDYPCRFQIGIFIEKNGFRMWPFTFVALGKDSDGLYLTPRTFLLEKQESGGTMDMALKFRKCKDY